MMQDNITATEWYNSAIRPTPMLKKKVDVLSTEYSISIHQWKSILADHQSLNCGVQ